MSCVALAGCAIPRQMFASPDDLADYRAFRLAAQQGTRLARAVDYLKRHPRGAWVDEVRAVFDAEEPSLFEAAKTSRARAREYVAVLPEGPHVEAARALLSLLQQDEADIDMLELLTDSRRTAATLDVESTRRRQVSETVLEELAVLIDPAISGARLDDPPDALASVLGRPPARTWGGEGPRTPPPSQLREDHLFFVLRTPKETEPRVAHVRLRLTIEHGRVAGGNIDGEDLFLLWTEADLMRVLDPSVPDDRASAANHIAEVLAGALEARLPGSRCAVSAQSRVGEIVARACAGWHASAWMGIRPGDNDVITVRGPK
jgi:hypothetical protein